MDERLSLMDIPVLTADQMREVDRVMIQDFRIELIQMMENAGRHLAGLAREHFLGGDPRGRTVVAYCGAGGNGGGGLVAARRLHGWGADVRVRLTERAVDYAEVPKHQLDIVRRLGIEVEEPSAPESIPERTPPTVILDALVGYGLRGDLQGEAARLVEEAGAAGTPVVSLDLPSGLDATTGSSRGSCVRAAATLTLAYPKTGLLAFGARKYVGDLYLADIGVPPLLMARSALRFSTDVVFAQSEVLRFDRSRVPSEPVLTTTVAALLEAASTAHHAAFAGTEGADSEWTLWYSAYARDALGGLLGIPMAEDHLARLLSEAAEAATKSEARHHDWAETYSRFLIRRLRR